jgi:hypothetical protein
MEAQVVIELSGGIAEAIYRGERRKHEVLRFVISRLKCIVTIGAIPVVSTLSPQRQ